MELKTTGKMQMNCFRRDLQAGGMQLNVSSPETPDDPRYYLKSKEKKYWAMLSVKQKTDMLERARQQAEKSQGTIFMPEKEQSLGRENQSSSFSLGRAKKKTKGYSKNIHMGSSSADLSRHRYTGSSYYGVGEYSVVHGSTRKGIPVSYYSGESEKRNTPAQKDAHITDERGFYNSASNENQIRDTALGGGRNSSANAVNKSSGYSSEKAAVQQAASKANTAMSAAVTGGGQVVVKAAQKAAGMVKQSFAAAMQKEDEQRKFYSEEILAEDGQTAAARSVHVPEMRIQKAVSAVIVTVAAILQTVFSFLLPSLVILGLILSLVAGILSFIFGGAASGYARANVSPECEQYRPIVRQYAEQYGMLDYVELILAVMMQESGGLLPDVMQAAEGAFNTRYPNVPNGIPDPEYSIQCGVQELKRALELAGCTGPADLEHIRLALQGYNYGEGYITWALQHYGGYSEENAAEFSDMMAAKMGWSAYGDKKYVEHVLRYYEIVSGGFGNVPAGGMKIPLYDQKDYSDVPFGGGSISTSGCAPTSFAMVASYLTGRQVTPVDAMSWCGNAYYVPGSGTSWSYFSAAASHFGIRVVAETTDAYTVMQALSEGKPVISSQAPGIFTSFGHFIVLRGVTASGKILVNDPNDSPGKNYANREFDMMSEIHGTSRNYWIFDR